MHGASRHGSVCPDPAGQGLDFKVCYGQVGLGAVNLCWARVSWRCAMRLGRVGRCEVWTGEGFRVGHGEFSSCPVWQGYCGSH